MQRLKSGCIQRFPRLSTASISALALISSVMIGRTSSRPVAHRSALCSLDVSP